MGVELERGYIFFRTLCPYMLWMGHGRGQWNQDVTLKHLLDGYWYGIGLECLIVCLSVYRFTTYPQTTTERLGLIMTIILMPMPMLQTQQQHKLQRFIPKILPCKCMNVYVCGFSDNTSSRTQVKCWVCWFQWQQTGAGQQQLASAWVCVCVCLCNHL